MSLPKRLMIPIGKQSEIKAVTYCYSPQGLCAKDSKQLLDSQIHDWRDKRIVVGSLEADRRNPLDRPGTELLAWALSDLSAQGSGRGIAPLTNPGLVFGLPLASAVVTVLVFYLGFSLTRSRSSHLQLPARVTIVSFAAILITMSIWAGLWAVFYWQRLALPASLSWFSCVCASIACWHRARTATDDALYVSGSDNDALPSSYDVFISYAHQPKEDALWVKENILVPLQALNKSDGKPLRIFFDEGSIRAGRDWKREIDRAIAGARIFVPVYTKRYFDSPQCQDELAFAEQRRSSGLMVMLPITRLPMHEVPVIYQKIQALDENQVCEFLTDTSGYFVEKCL
jgi:hypothetical protein